MRETRMKGSEPMTKPVWRSADAGMGSPEAQRNVLKHAKRAEGRLRCAEGLPTPAEALLKTGFVSGSRLS